MNIFRNENLRRDVEEYSAKSLSFFVQFHKQVMQNLAKMDVSSLLYHNKHLLMIIVL